MNERRVLDQVGVGFQARIAPMAVRAREPGSDIVSAAEIGTASVEPGRLSIRSSLDAIPGDANFDERFDISDPVSVLNYLFLGGESPACQPAADFNADQLLDTSDPIAMLGVLFLGETPNFVERVHCREN